MTISSSSLEEKVVAYKKIVQQIAELEEKKKELSLSILEQMETKSTIVSGYVVRRYERLNISTDLTQARAWQATKMQEVADKDKLKQLHQEGHDIPGISKSEYIQVSSKCS